VSKRRDPHRHDARAAIEELETTRDLVEEVLLTAIALDDVMTALLAELPEQAFPGEDNAQVLLQMVVGSAHPAARAAGLTASRTATALVAAIRERVLTDLHRAAELSRHRDR